jgi:predicted TIM-barrel fold metal-dependent hydrolase
MDVPVVDVHTHTFNSRYLPVKGIVELKAHERGLELADGFSSLVAKLVYGLTSSAPIGAEAALTGPQEFEMEEGERRRLLEFLGQPEAAGLTQRTDEELLIETLETLGFLADADHESDAEAFGLGKALQYAHFVRTLLRHEETIVRDLASAYSDQPSLYVHHMMDMGLTYDDQPPFDFDEQIERATSLAAGSKGKLMTFVAYDPFRDAAALAMVEQGVAKGCVGVKFYPPSGYRPTGNDIEDPGGLSGVRLDQWRSRYGNLQGDTLSDKNDRLDTLNRELFAFCADRGVPIFTHSSYGGFEAAEGYGERHCDPELWIDVLERHPSLKVCFGHAGGYEGWMDAAPWPYDADTAGVGKHKRYERKVFELCVKYPGVYAGFGYHNFDSDGAADQLRAKLLQLIRSQGVFSTKIVYGTDWHMCAKEKDPALSLWRFDKAFRGDLEEYRRRFFAGNAVEYLGLRRRFASPSDDTDSITRLLEALDE